MLEQSARELEEDVIECVNRIVTRENLSYFRLSTPRGIQTFLSIDDDAAGLLQP